MAFSPESQCQIGQLSKVIANSDHNCYNRGNSNGRISGDHLMAIDED